MKKIGFIILLVSTGIFLNSCSKNHGTDSDSAKHGQVTIHMLSKSVFVPDRCQIDISKSEVDGAAIVRNDEILGYSAIDHQFYVSQTAYRRIESLTGLVGFAVAVNGKPVYYGVYKPFYSSSSCDHSITLSPLKINNNHLLFINLGYPGPPTGIVIADERNKAELIDVLRAQGKLR